MGPHTCGWTRRFSSRFLHKSMLTLRVTACVGGRGRRAGCTDASVFWQLLGTRSCRSAGSETGFKQRTAHNIGVLIIKIGFGVILYSIYNKEPPKIVLVII